MALALRLGMTLERMETEMPHDEMVEWMAYFDILATAHLPQPMEPEQIMRALDSISKPKPNHKAKGRRK